MTISHVNSAAAAATSLTMPTGRQVGDLEIMFAFRSGNTGAPTVPAGWTLIKSTTTTSTFGGAYYRWCTNAADTSGTWTSASDLLCAVYRGCYGVGGSAALGAVSTTITFPAVTMVQSAGNSWVIGVAGHRTATNLNSVLPTGMINRTSVGAGPMVANYDTNGGVASWSQQTTTVNANSGNIGITIELLADSSTMNPYDKNTLVTLASGNKTVTATATTNFQEGVRSAYQHTTGKWLISVTPTLAGSNPYFSFGPATAAGSLNQAGLNLDDLCINYFTNDLASIVKMNTSQIGTNLPIWPTGVKLFAAIDLTNKLAWVYINGNWYGTSGVAGANPDSGLDGFNFSSINAGPYYPLISMGDTTSSVVWDGLCSGAPSNCTTFLPWDSSSSAAPAGQDDWPNPTLRRAMPIGIDSQPEGSAENLTTLMGQDRVYGNPGQVPDYDWPNPTLSRALPAGITSQPLGSERNVNLLVGQDALPVRQRDWPNPVLRIPPQRAIEAQTNGMGLADATAFPLTMQNDIPNPTLRVYRMQAIIQSQTAPLNLTTLVGQDRFYGAAGEVVCYDWPNPQGPPRRTIAMDAQPLGALITLSAATAAPTSQDDWPNPRGSQPVHQLQPLGSPLILSTLVGKDALPFRQSDWPNPVLRISSVAAINAQPEGSPLNVTTLVGQDKLAFRELDWPNPVLRVSFVAAINSQILGQTTPVEEAEVVSAQTDWPVPPGWQPRTQTQPLGSPLNITLLVGKDALPFRELDWPNPILRPSSVAAIAAQPSGSPLNLTTLPGQDALPFRQREWPVPATARQPERPSPLGSPSILTVLVGQDALPLRQRDWPNPRGAQQPTQTQPYGTPPAFLSPAVPFAQTSWPVPPGARQPTQTQPFGSPGVLTLLVGQDRLPIRQLTWENPRAPAQPVQTQPLGMLAALQAAQTPFAQLVWPNPPGARSLPIVQPDGAPGLLGVLVGKDRLPSRLLDWPNPGRPAAWIVALHGQPQGGKASDAPLRPVDIPNPPGLGRAVALAAQPLGGQVRVAAVPVLAVDLPVPVPRAVPATLSQPLGSPLLLTVLPGQDALPFRQSEWPNPPGAQPHMQTGPEGVPSLLRPDTLPPIIAHPELLGSEVPADLEGSETAINLGASQTPLALAGSDAQVALKGSVVVINLKGGVDT